MRRHVKGRLRPDKSQSATPKRLAIASAIAMLFTAPAAIAETSSWSRRAPETPPALAGAASPRVTPTLRESIPSAGQQGNRGPVSPVQGPLPGLEKKLGVPTVRPSGENAAYIAYEMGLYGEALRLATEEAERNDPAAHTLLGLLHSRGLGVETNLKAAASWYAKAAELGDVEGAFGYGLMLAKGEGVAEDKAKAVAMFEKAALEGHAYAHYNLGLAFLSGQGKPENPQRAAAHLQFAAERGIARAQYDLATLYREGHGVEADAYMASYWLRRAAGNGLTEAEYEYAVSLLKGEGLNEDKPYVVDYLSAAARKGVSGAQNRLAYIYFDGLLMRENPVEAAKWRLLAKAGGVADEALDKKVAELSEQDRKKAERAAQEFQDSAAVGVALGN